MTTNRRDWASDGKGHMACYYSVNAEDDEEWPVTRCNDARPSPQPGPQLSTYHRTSPWSLLDIIQYSYCAIPPHTELQLFWHSAIITYERGSGWVFVTAILPNAWQPSRLPGPTLPAAVSRAAVQSPTPLHEGVLLPGGAA